VSVSQPGRNTPTGLHWEVVGPPTGKIFWFPLSSPPQPAHSFGCAFGPSSKLACPHQRYPPNNVCTHRWSPYSAHVKVRNSHQMPRPFNITVILFQIRRAHEKFASWNPNQFAASLGVANHIPRLAEVPKNSSIKANHSKRVGRKATGRNPFNQRAWQQSRRRQTVASFVD
jgi:hypothetical protein